MLGQFETVRLPCIQNHLTEMTKQMAVWLNIPGLRENCLKRRLCLIERSWFICNNLYQQSSLPSLWFHKFSDFLRYP